MAPLKTLTELLVSGGVRERAAVAWAEAVTRLTDKEMPDEVYDQARKKFSDKELAQWPSLPSTGGTGSMSRSTPPQAVTSPRSNNQRPGSRPSSRRRTGWEIPNLCVMDLSC